MGKTLLAAVIASLCVLPSPSDAQPPAGGSSVGATFRSDPPPAPAPPPPQPPPPAGPLVPVAPPSALDSVDIFRAGPRTYAPRFDRSSRRRNVTGYASGYYPYITDPFGYISQPESSAPQLDRYMRQNEGIGYLRIDGGPDDARVYVDGLYVGTAGDSRRAGLPVGAGPHRVEVRADGFETVGFDVQIRANDMVSYRGSPARREQRAEARPAGPPKTFYVIPRCYAGDSLPRPELLPAGCDAARVRAVPPVVNSARPVR